MTEISVFEAVALNEGQPNKYGADHRTWARPDDQLVDFLPGLSAYVLPYGSTATAGRFTCTMAETGIDCTDAQSTAGFHLSKADLTLR